MATKQTKSVDLRNGLALDSAELAALSAAGIRAQSRVEPRRPADKLVLVCDESGGGARDIGHYVGFLPLAGASFISSQKRMALGKNSIHRHIVASSLIRFEVFRYMNNFVHAWITLYRADPSGGNDRSQMMRQTLFRGKFGEVDKSGNVTFPSEDGGVDLTVPAFLLDGFNAALLGTRCRDCQHAGHFESVAHVKLPEGTLAALRIVTPGAKPEGEKPAATADSTSARKKAAKSTAAA